MRQAINIVPITQAIKQAIIAITLVGVMLAIVSVPFICAGLVLFAG